MGRMYTVQFENVAVTVAQDFFDIIPGDDQPCTVHAIFISQSTETGDAQEEMLRVQIIRGLATVGSGGSAPTPELMNENDGAATFTTRVNDTTVAVVGGGSTEILHSESFNVRTGWIYIPTPEMRPSVSQAKTRLVVTLKANPADSVTMNGTIYIEEF